MHEMTRIPAYQHNETIEKMHFYFNFLFYISLDANTFYLTKGLPPSHEIHCLWRPPSIQYSGLIPSPDWTIWTIWAMPAGV